MCGGVAQDGNGNLVVVASMLANILVASDLSQSSQAATICGCELAGKLDASVHLIHAVGDQAALPWTAEAFAVPSTDLIPAWQDEARQGLLLWLPLEYCPAVTISTPVGHAVCRNHQVCQGPPR